MLHNEFIGTKNFIPLKVIEKRSTDYDAHIIMNNIYRFQGFQLCATELVFATDTRWSFKSWRKNGTPLPAATVYRRPLPRSTFADAEGTLN